VPELARQVASTAVGRPRAFNGECFEGFVRKWSESSASTTAVQYPGLRSIEARLAWQGLPADKAHTHSGG